MSHDVMMRSAVISHGLRFYLPGKVDGNYLNAIDEYERLVNNPVEELAAVAAWPGFDNVQLTQYTRDRDAKLSVRYCHDVKVPHGYEIAGITDDARILLLEIKSSEPA